MGEKIVSLERMIKGGGKLNDEEVLTKNPDLVSREIEGEIILLPVFKTSEEANCIYTLNKAGGEVWRLIDGKRKVKEIRKIILEKFAATPEEVDKKLEELIKDLKKIKAII